MSDSLQYADSPRAHADDSKNGLRQGFHSWLWWRVEHPRNTPRSFWAAHLNRSAALPIAVEHLHQRFSRTIAVRLSHSASQSLIVKPAVLFVAKYTDRTTCTQYYFSCKNIL
ncbi:hypothetical protein G2912_30850 [Paraburkholderia aspalathi]|uniref:hypothetical protein n=1 Tax=Paraburkholderia nemoris TaxID=2793076 RepID=UPI00190C376A|nr:MULTISPECIES: hypothetical protein [Paraburkholderia]MBK3814753.1 hypothetical protein [Paraburkholderia aspalathi]